MALIIANSADMTNFEWRKNRQKGIGGSDAGIIMGVSNFTNKIGLFIDKTMPIVEFEEETELQYWGHVLEPVIAAEFAKRHGDEFEVIEDTNVYQHETDTFMLANVDRRLVNKKTGEKGVLEIKTAGEFMKDKWQGNNIPASYWIQVQHYLHVLDLKYAYIAVLIGGHTYKDYIIYRNDDYVQKLVAEEREFWDRYVINRELPPIEDYSDDTTRDITAIFENPEKDAEIRINDEKYSKITEMYLLTNELSKELTAINTACSNRLKYVMGNAEIAVINNCHSVTWKKSKVRRTFKAETYKKIDVEKYFELKEEIYEVLPELTNTKAFKG